MPPRILSIFSIIKNTMTQNLRCHWMGAWYCWTPGHTHREPSPLQLETLLCSRSKEAHSSLNHEISKRKFCYFQV